MRGIEDAQEAYRAPGLGRVPRRAHIVNVAVAAILLLGLASVAVWASPAILRPALVLVGALTVGYAYRRERTHRRLSSRLSDERVLAAAYSNRVRDLSALVSTARTINGVLDLDDALRILLEEALGVFQGKSGSIMLLDGAGFLQTVCSKGNDAASDARIRIGDSIAGHVALTREAILVSGSPSPERFRHLVERDEDQHSAMSVPLLHRNELLGVLNVNAAPGRSFNDHDLQLLTVFAGQASIAVANARVFQSERDRLSELSDLNRMKSELIASISQDLRAPVSALLGGLGAVRRSVLDDPDATDVLDALQEHLDRLAGTVDRLLSEAEVRSEQHASPMADTDLRAVAEEVATDFTAGGQPVEVTGDTCMVHGDADLLQQVLWNLLDNAFKYGAPPISIEVTEEEEHGLVSVIDRGPGIAPGDRERIFERFSRIQAGNQQGMGLGLSIVHGIVAACGGRVWADDAVGGGAVFRVALPLAGDRVQARKEISA